MKSVLAIATGALLVASHAAAFSGTSSFSGSQVAGVSASNNAGLTMEYIPSGMSKEQWKKMKEQETKKKQGKNLGANGITSFKSRTFAEWQKAGGVNLFPVDPNSVKDPREIPYMQRKGGMADDSDLKKPKKSNSDLKKPKKSTGGFFGSKKKAPEPVAEPEKKKNWWSF